MKIEILGVKIDIIDRQGVITKISEWLRGESQHLVTTINPEFLVEANKNKEFKDVLNFASLNTCDGMGLVLMSGRKLIRVTGVDITEDLLNGKMTGAKLYLLGGSQTSIDKLRKKYSNIVGGRSGGKLKDGKFENQHEIIEDIKSSKANIILVALGQVKQEKWINDNLSKIKQVRVGIGIGGTFDYLSGEFKRPPKVFRSLGLEWLYRLIKQPSRIGRIWRAVVVFPLLVLLKK
jgi:N-acetylglucosaminyldiphosphoundecaprenol N-acetyl-beta-D-mannosaminyltransferase